MKKTSLIAILLAVCTVTFAQTARKFVLSNSADGQSEITVYLPEKPNAKGMAIVDCPGGGYQHLAMNHEGHDWAPFYNAQGIAYVVLKYRMPNGDRNIPLTDAYNAIRTVRDSAAVWHINPYAVGIQGFSAGGHLASAVSTHAPFDARPNFSVLFYPVISMDGNISHQGSCVNFLGEGCKDEKLVKEWSSNRAVHRHLTPPAILFTANDDRTVPPVTNCIAYYSAMRNNGNDCSLVVWPKGGHGFGFRSTFTYHEQMKSELLAWLNNLPLQNANDKRIACVGNSITDGHGIEMASQRGYPAELEAILGDGYKVKNFGVSARTAINNGDHPYMKELAWRDCLAWNPEIVVIKLGTNDTKEHHRENLSANYISSLQEMIDSLRRLPSNPRIIICSPIPALKDSWTISEEVITNTIIPAQLAVVKKNNCEYLDLHTLFAPHANHMMDDGIHPLQSGAKLIAGFVAEAIKTEPVPVKKQKKTKKSK